MRKLLTGSSKLVSLSNATRQGAWPTARRPQLSVLDVGGVTSVQILAGKEALIYSAAEPLSCLTSGLSQMHRQMSTHHPRLSDEQVRSLPCLLVCQMKLDHDGSNRDQQHPEKIKSEFKMSYIPPHTGCVCGSTSIHIWLFCAMGIAFHCVYVHSGFMGYWVRVVEMSPFSQTQ